jgi:predicted amidohydrolase YtcJ
MMTPAKKITREEAIKMYTINSAKVMEWEDKIGSIEAGKLADFAVLDRDILTVPVNQIRDARVLMTALGGKTVYGAIP